MRTRIVGAKTTLTRFNSTRAPGPNLSLDGLRRRWRDDERTGHDPRHLNCRPQRVGVADLPKNRVVEESMTTLSLLSNTELLEEAQRLAASERTATTALVRCLIEVEDRALHLAQGCASMFVYCTDVLHLCEGAAYNRIQAARTARKFPVILERLADGSLTLTAVRLLGPHLTDDNCARVLTSAIHAKKRELEELVASLVPKPDVANARPVIHALAPERYKLQLTVAKDTRHAATAPGPATPLHPGRRSLAHRRSRPEAAARRCAAAEVRHDETPVPKPTGGFRVAQHPRSRSPRRV